MANEGWMIAGAAAVVYFLSQRQQSFTDAPAGGGTDEGYRLEPYSRFENPTGILPAPPLGVTRETSPVQSLADFMTDMKTAFVGTPAPPTPINNPGQGGGAGVGRPTYYPQPNNQPQINNPGQGGGAGVGRPTYYPQPNNRQSVAPAQTGPPANPQSPGPSLPKFLTDMKRFFTGK